MMFTHESQVLVAFWKWRTSQDHKQLHAVLVVLSQKWCKIRDIVITGC